MMTSVENRQPDYQRSLYLDKFEVFFACTTLWTNPVGRHIFPFCARSNPFFGKASFFIIYPATNKTHPRTHIFLLTKLQAQKTALLSASIRMGAMLLNPIA